MEYKFIDDKVIIEFAEKHLHLSYSTEKEVGEFFKELKNIKGINFSEFIEKMEIELNNNRKHDTMKFLKIIREYRNPVMSKAMNKVKGLTNSIKNKGLTVEVPKNLEGDTLTLTWTIRSAEDVEKIMGHLEKKKEDIKSLITTIKCGG
jgi:methionine-rich copper-binding protein CopC